MAGKNQEGPKKLTEAQFRRSLVETLRKLGFIVLTVGGGFSACPHCKKRMVGGNGSSPGVPDLFVTTDMWADATWIGIELKLHGGLMSDAQKKLFDGGHVYLLRPGKSYGIYLAEVLGDVPGKDVRSVLEGFFAGLGDEGDSRR